MQKKKTCGEKTEVYSRVVGYFRPISQRVEASGQKMIDFLEKIGARLCESGALDKDADAVIKKIVRPY